MNKRERADLHTWLAEQKYNDEPSGPAAFARVQASREVMEIFKINPEDLDFDYMWQVFKLTGHDLCDDKHSELWDRFSDLWDALGEDRIVEMLEAGDLIKSIFN